MDLKNIILTNTNNLTIDYKLSENYIPYNYQPGVIFTKSWYGFWHFNEEFNPVLTNSYKKMLSSNNKYMENKRRC